MPKKPQDHKTKQDTHEEPEVVYTDLAGHEYLTPLNELSAGQKFRVLGLLEDAGLMDEATEAVNTEISLRELAEVLDGFATSPAVADAAGYEQFDRESAPADVAQLVVAYAVALGKTAA